MTMPALSSPVKVEVVGLIIYPTAATMMLMTATVVRALNGV
jgi:hypothetical protein